MANPTKTRGKSMPARAASGAKKPAAMAQGGGNGAGWPLNGPQTRSLNANLDKLADLTTSIKKQLGPILQGQNLTSGQSAGKPASARGQGGAGQNTA